MVDPVPPSDALPDDCRAFDASVAELALDLLEPEDAGALAAHAASCARCRSELDALTGVADRLVELAPPAAPPPGFEAAALASFRSSSVPATSASAVSSGSSDGSVSSRRRLLAAAAAVVLLLGLGLATLWSLSSGDHHGVRTGQLADAGGRAHGAVVVATDDDRTVLTVTLADVPPGRYRCGMRTADGVTVDVAGWPIRQRGSASWDVELHGAAADGTAVVITDDAGREVAAADLR